MSMINGGVSTATSSLHVDFNDDKLQTLSPIPSLSQSSDSESEDEHNYMKQEYKKLPTDLADLQHFLKQSCTASLVETAVSNQKNSKGAITSVHLMSVEGDPGYGEMKEHLILKELYDEEIGVNHTHVATICPEMRNMKVYGNALFSLSLKH